MELTLTKRIKETVNVNIFIFAVLSQSQRSNVTITFPSKFNGIIIHREVKNDYIFIFES